MEEYDIVIRAPGQNPQAPSLPITERRTRYDDVVDRIGGNIPVPDMETQAPRSKYDDVVDRLEEQHNQLLDATISTAVRQDPNRAGEAQRLSAETGVPTEIAGRNIEELRQRAIEQRIRQMRLAQTNPILARQMRDPEFAAIAYDEVENLSTTESIFRWFQEIPEDIQIGWEAGRLTTEIGYLGERAMTGRSNDKDISRIGSLQQKLQELRGSDGFLEAASKILGQQADTLPEALQYGAYTGMGAGTIAAIAGQAGPQIAVPEEIITVPSATIGGFFAGTMAKMGEQSYRIEAGHAYLDMIEAGVDRNVAVNVGAGVGLVNAGLEVVGLSFIGRPIKSAMIRSVTERVSERLQQTTIRTAVQNFAINYGLAVGGETTTEVIQEMVNIAGLELGKQLSQADMESLLTSEDGRQEIADRLVDAFEEIAKGMAVLALPGAGFSFRYDYRRAQDSKRQQEFFQSLNDAAASSEVRNRNPAAYERFIENQAQDTLVENIYIDAKELDNVLNQSGVTRQQLEVSLPEVAAQLDEDVATGSDVIIPTSQYAARVAGTDLGNAVMDHVRVTQEGMSIVEARKFSRDQQSLMNDAKRIMDEQSVKDETFNQGAQEVRRQVFDQIKGTRTYTDKVARTYADMVRDFVVTHSAALNMNPRDFYQQYMYRVQAAERARMDDTQMFDQAGQVIPKTADFQEFYSHQEGNPQVLDHGTPDQYDAQRRSVLDQQERGGFDPRKLTTILNEQADYSTFLHETAHFFLTVYADMVQMPNATQQMRDDMQTVLDWFGVKDIDTWNAMSLNEQRKYHESFAYNFEIYLFDGKAPSVKMQTMFDKFATLLRTVYKSIRDELNAIYREENGVDLPILTGEVRQVMDRMLASEEQIQQAQQVRNMMPTFQTQEQSGMNDTEWSAYQDILREAEEMAVTDLTRASVRQMKWLSNARSRVIKNLQKEADTLRKQIGMQVSEEVKQLPVYRAMEFLKHGRTVDQIGTEIEVLQGNKLSIDSVNALYPESTTGLEIRPDISKLGYGKYDMLAKDGLPVEIVAEMFGFNSSDTMIRALLNAKPLKEEIDARTDTRMLEEHGELSTPTALEQAVEQALHNDARARFVAVELRFLAKSTAPVRVMNAAAKQVANQIISAKIIKEIKPRDYSVAEARSSREAQAASKKGSTIEAARAKQNQLVQNQLAAEAVAARQEVQKAIAEFRKLFEADDLLSKISNMDLVNAARSIVAYYGLGKKDKPPTEYIKQLRAYNLDIYNDIAPLIQDAATGAKNYTDLTMDEFRMMRDTVEALWFQSKREKQIMIEGKAMNLEQVVGDLNTRLEEIGFPSEVVGETAAPSTKDRVVRQINVTKAILRRVEHWADATDGQKGIGPFTKYIWRPVREALDKYRAERNVYVKRYVDMVKKVDLKVGKIESNELGYVFGNANGSIGKAELLGALLHTGNESNLRKLLVGRGWGKINEDGTLNASRWYAFQQRMIDEGRLTKDEFDWAQSVWDLTEEMKPMAQKAHKEIFGYYFKEVASTPVNTPFGVYRGGYVPAKIDPFMVRDAQKNAKLEELEGDFRNSMPSTGMGFTKGRVEYNKPLSLDIRIMTKHIDDVIRFAFVQPAIKDVLKIVRNREFSGNLSRIDPSVVEEMLLPWLNRAARQITMEPGMHKAVDTFWQGLRNRTGIAIMFANITNALQQMTGYFPAALKVKGTYLKTAMALYMRNPHKTSQEISEMSLFMDDRMHKRMFDVQEIMNEILLNPNKFNKMQQWSQRHGYFLQKAFQNQVDIVVWMGKYNEVLADLGKDVSDAKAHKEAITQADAAVRMTQDSYAVEDVAAFQVGSPFYKTFTQFAGYFNMMANLNGSEYVKVMRDLGWRGNKGKLFSIYLLGFAMPMLLSEAIVKTLAGNWDDDDDDGYLDEVADWFFMSQLRGAVASIPGFGPGILAISNTFNNKPYDDRMTTSPSVSMLEGATFGVAKATINIVNPERDVTGKNVRDIFTLLSLTTGIPLIVLGRPIGYAVDVEREHIDPTSDADYIRGQITGKVSESSR